MGTRFEGYYGWKLSFLKLAALKSSYLESPDRESDVMDNARRVKAYIYTLQTMTTNCFSMRFCYKGPNLAPESFQVSNIRNLA